MVLVVLSSPSSPTTLRPSGIKWLRHAKPEVVSPARLRPSGLRRAPRFALRASRGCATRSPKGEAWWSQAGSNRRPLACHASALPAELWPRNRRAPQISWRAGMTLNHSSGPISSLFVAADVTNDVGDVLVTLFLVGLLQRHQFLGLCGLRRIGGGIGGSSGARGIATGCPWRHNRRNRHNL